MFTEYRQRSHRCDGLVLIQICPGSNINEPKYSDVIAINSIILFTQLSKIQYVMEITNTLLKLKCRQYPAIHIPITVNQTVPFQTRKI